MLAVLRELTDRFIEFILKNVKGDSEEAKLVAALKTLALTITVLIWMVVGLLFSNINLRIDFNDLNLGMERMSVIFSATDENPFYKFLKVNDALSARNERLVKDNSSLLKQNVRLTQQNVYLMGRVESNETELHYLRDLNLGLSERCLNSQRVKSKAGKK